MTDAQLQLLIRMQDEASDRIANVEEKLKKLGNQAEEAEKKTSRFQNTLQKGAQVGAFMARSLATGALAIGGAAVAATAFGVKSAASFEQTRIAIETMVGSGEKARQLLSNISTFAAKTPFEFPELAATTKQMLAFGFAQDDVMKQLRVIGNLSAGLGVPMGQLAFTFGQVRVAGKLMGQDLNQFINAGVPIIELLATTLKKPQGEIKKLVEQGKVSFRDVETALHSLAGEGGKWSDLMDRQSASLAGRWSTLKDVFSQTARTALGLTQDGDIIKGGFFDKLTTAAQQLIDWLNRNQEQIQAVANTLITSFIQALNFTINALRPVIAGLIEMIRWLNEHRVVVAAAAGVITGFLLVAFYHWATAAAVAAAATIAATWPIIALGAAVGAAAYLVVNNWDKIKFAFLEGREWLSSNAGIVRGIILGMFTNPMSAAVAVIRGHWGQVRSAFASGLNSAIDLINRGVQSVNRLPGVNIPQLARVSFQMGGVMREDGLAFLHKGERVLTAQRSRFDGGQGVTVNVNVYGPINGGSPESMQDMARMLGRQIMNAGVGI